MVLEIIVQNCELIMEEKELSERERERVRVYEKQRNEEIEGPKSKVNQFQIHFWILDFRFYLNKNTC